MAVGDFTGDGLADVAVSSEYYFDPASDYKVFVFAQQGGWDAGGAGQADTHAQYGDRMGLAAVDFNDDEFTDLALATAVGVELFLQRAGALALGAAIDSPDARHVEVADMDGDGIDDCPGRIGHDPDHSQGHRGQWHRAHGHRPSGRDELRPEQRQRTRPPPRRPSASRNPGGGQALRRS